MKRLFALIVLLASLNSALAEPINVLSWNVESGHGVSDPEVIAEQIEQFSGYELLSFSEVDPDDAETYASACVAGESANFEYLQGTTGGNDGLLLVWNSDRFEALEELELMELRAMTGRAPLAVKLKEKNTPNVFWFMVNHLHRGSASKRNEQAAGLREWIRQQSVPVIAMGDYNMDYDITSGQGNDAFDIIRQGNHVRWIEPVEKKKTQVAYNSILDFVFVNDDASSWQISSKIIVLPGEFNPEDEKSDHRPVEATINIPTHSPTPSPLSANFAASPANGRGRRRLELQTAAPRASAMTASRMGPEAARPGVASFAPRPQPRQNRNDLLLEQIRLMKNQLELMEQMLSEGR